MYQLIPFQFQTDCLSEIDHFNGRAGVFLEMGLGKTPIALWWLEQHPEAWPAIVVCPASVKYHWEHQARHVIGTRAAVLEGQRPSRNGVMKPNLVIVNYDILRFWVDWLRELKAKTIIIDESQRLMNPKSKRTKATRKLCRNVPNVLALSGTPLLNRPVELFPTLNLLRPKVFRSFYAFAHKFCGAKWTPWGWNFRGSSHSDELHQLLTTHLMIRKRKKDVLKDLPDKIREVITLPIRRPEEYQKASTDFLNWLQQIDPLKARKAMKAQTLVKMGYLLRLSARLKLWYVVEWVNKFLEESEGEKLVLFAVHRKMIEALKRRCKAKSVVVDGSIIGRKRQAAVDQFQGDQKTRLLIGNIQAAGEGITLTAASTVAFSELPWRPGDCVQGEDRCHRIGAKSTCFAFYLVAHGTIETDLCELLQKKQEVLSAVLDGEKGVEGLDVFNQLLQRLQEK